MERERDVHPAVLEPIRRLRSGQVDAARRRQLNINIVGAVNRQSIQYLVDFLREEDSHEVKYLMLRGFGFVQPSDGGLDILREFLATDTTLTDLYVGRWHFSSEEEALQLFTALHTNASITSLHIRCNRNLHDTTFAACLSGLLEHSRLERIDCVGVALSTPQAIRAFQPALQANRHLKKFTLGRCQINDEGLSLIVDSLVENETLEKLYFYYNNTTANGISHLARLVEFSQLKEIHAPGVAADVTDDVVQNLTRAVHQNTSLERLAVLDSRRHPRYREEIQVMNNIILTRNRSIKRAKALLALQPLTGLPIKSKSGVWYKAMAQLAPDSSGYGASSIFHILQTRPALLERQLQRPPPQQQQQQHPVLDTRADAGEDGNTSHYDEDGGGRKRARLS